MRPINLILKDTHKQAQDEKGKEQINLINQI